MNKLHELKDLLCEELEQYGSKNKLDVGGLEIVDKLAHAIKNIDKIIESEESYSNYYPDGMSYERGRMNARRDSRGRYSSRRYMDGYSRASEDMVAELRELMDKAPDESTRREFQKLITTIEKM